MPSRWDSHRPKKRLSQSPQWRAAFHKHVRQTQGLESQHLPWSKCCKAAAILEDYLLQYFSVCFYQAVTIQIHVPNFTLPLHGPPHSKSSCMCIFHHFQCGLDQQQNWQLKQHSSAQFHFWDSPFWFTCHHFAAVFFIMSTFWLEAKHWRFELRFDKGFCAKTQHWKTLCLARRGVKS